MTATLVVVPNSTDKMSVTDDQDFQKFVSELNTCKLRGEECTRDAVKVINAFRERFGDSEKELKRLAKAIGVTTRTIYRWKAQVEGKPKTSTPKKKAKRETFYIARKKDHGTYEGAEFISELQAHGSSKYPTIFESPERAIDGMTPRQESGHYTLPYRKNVEKRIEYSTQNYELVKVTCSLQPVPVPVEKKRKSKKA
jgi:hypothetical protein